MLTQLLRISAICLMLAAGYGCDKAHDQDDAVEAADGGDEGMGANDDAAVGASMGSSGDSAAGSGGKDNPAGASGSAAGASGSAAGSGGDNAAAGRGGRGPSGGRSGQAGGGSQAGSGGSAAAGSGSGGGGARRCGTRGGVQCGADQFCNHEPDTSCGATDKGGVCEDKPQVCTAIYAPVCGCDNQTYSSACNAHGAGVSVKSDGECGSSGGGGGGSSGGRTCGGIAALECDGKQFCNYEESAGGQGCNGQIADAAGVCQDPPQACTRDYRPVCSCDRKSYSNHCSANAEGASVMHDGACTEFDCEVFGGRVVYGLGPAPQCAQGETEYTWITNSDGSMPIEGAICCVK